jgi:hypothetical protein
MRSPERACPFDVRRATVVPVRAGSEVGVQHRGPRLLCLQEEWIVSVATEQQRFAGSLDEKATAGHDFGYRDRALLVSVTCLKIHARKDGESWPLPAAKHS